MQASFSELATLTFGSIGGMILFCAMSLTVCAKLHKGQDILRPRWVQGDVMLRRPIKQGRPRGVPISHGPAHKAAFVDLMTAQDLDPAAPVIRHNLGKKGVHLGDWAFDPLIVDVVFPMQKACYLPRDVVGSREVEHLPLLDPVLRHEGFATVEDRKELGHAAAMTGRRMVVKHRPAAQKLSGPC